MTVEYFDLKIAKKDADNKLQSAKAHFEQLLKNRDFDNILNEYNNLTNVIDEHTVLNASIDNDIDKLIKETAQKLFYGFVSHKELEPSDKLGLATLQMAAMSHEWQSIKLSANLLNKLIQKCNLSPQEINVLDDLFDYANISPTILSVESFQYINGHMKQLYIIDTMKEVYNGLNNWNHTDKLDYKTTEAIEHMKTIFSFNPYLDYFVPLDYENQKWVDELKSMFDDINGNAESILSDNVFKIPTEAQSLVNRICDLADGREFLEKVMNEIEL